MDMRGTEESSGTLFSHVDLVARIPARHPLGRIRQVVNDALVSFDADFEELYTDFGRPPIAPERLIRAGLIQTGSERQLMEQMQHNLLFRWFVGLGIDDPAWDEGRPGIRPEDGFQPNTTEIAPMPRTKPNPRNASPIAGAEIGQS